MDNEPRSREQVERDRRTDRVLAGALKRPESERASFVEEACAGDEALQRRVLRLLKMAEAEDDVLATGAALQDEPGGPFGPEAALDAAGRRLGPYRLLSPLGQGGSATVYLAERADGAFEQEVAVKVLHAVEGAGELAERFAQERQILAALKHPSIAVLLDGGTTPWGPPYLVVERVRGEPIDKFCDAHHLSPAERLGLFLDVAGAVQHAHQHLIVHRDIKPSNILVTEERQVKLLDFGIAKLLDDDPRSGQAQATGTVAMWMTPRYASPEQLLGESITTASDVYQLGVLLYELLTGQPAFQVTEPTPSALVSAARERSSLQPRRVAAISADLNAIVMMATRPEPERRYTSVARLADDVHAFLERRPVGARGDSLLYRGRRFASRHRIAVSLSAAFVVALVAFSAALLWGFLNAQRERQRAESIGSFLKDTLRSARPHVAQGRDTALLEAILADAAQRIETELADQPYAAADVHLILAETHRTLSNFEQALIHAEAAGAAFTGRLGPDAEESLHADQMRGLVRWELGRNEEAERVLQDLLPRAERTLGASHPLTATIVSSLGLVTRAQGRPAEAEPLYRRAVDLSTRSNGLTSDVTIGMIGNLAFLLAELDRLEEAEPLARQAADLSREHLGHDNPDTYLAIDKLGSLLSQSGRLEEAHALHREAYAGLQRLLGDRHSTTLGSAYATSILLRRLGRNQEGIAILRSMLPIIGEDYGRESRFYAPTLHELGKTLLADGRPREALPHLEEACALTEARLSRDHHLYAVFSIQLADALVETGHAARARALLVHARALLERTFGDDGTHRHFGPLVAVESKLPAS